MSELVICKLRKKPYLALNVLTDTTCCWIITNSLYSLLCKVENMFMLRNENNFLIAFQLWSHVSWLAGRCTGTPARPGSWEYATSVAAAASNPTTYALLPRSWPQNVGIRCQLLMRSTICGEVDSRCTQNHGSEPGEIQRTHDHGLSC